MIQGICQFRIDSTIGKMALVNKWLQKTYSFYKTYIKVESIFVLLTLLNLGTKGLITYDLEFCVIPIINYISQKKAWLHLVNMYNEFMLHVTVKWISFLQVLYPVICSSDMMFIQITIVHLFMYVCMYVLYIKRKVLVPCKKNNIAKC